MGKSPPHHNNDPPRSTLSPSRVKLPNSHDDEWWVMSYILDSPTPFASLRLNIPLTIQVREGIIIIWFFTHCYKSTLMPFLRRMVAIPAKKKRTTHSLPLYSSLPQGKMTLSLNPLNNHFEDDFLRLPHSLPSTTKTNLTNSAGKEVWHL